MASVSQHSRVPYPYPYPIDFYMYLILLSLLLRRPGYAYDSKMEIHNNMIFNGLGQF